MDKIYKDNLERVDFAIEELQSKLAEIDQGAYDNLYDKACILLGVNDLDDIKEPGPNDPKAEIAYQIRKLPSYFRDLEEDLDFLRGSVSEELERLDEEE